MSVYRLYVFVEIIPIGVCCVVRKSKRRTRTHITSAQVSGAYYVYVRIFLIHLSTFRIEIYVHTRYYNYGQQSEELTFKSGLHSVKFVRCTVIIWSIYSFHDPA